MDERRWKVKRLKGLIERGDYRVDPQVIADALLAHLRGESPGGDSFAQSALADLGEHPYNECSYPRSAERSESVKRMRGFPAQTRPTQVTRSSQLRAAVSAAARALGGTQTQSS